MHFSLRKIEVQPSGKCNLSCIYCLGRALAQSDKPRILSSKILLPLARAVRQADIGHVVVSAMSGEPLLNPHTAAFIAEVKRGPSPSQYVGLHTNGILLNDDLIEILTSENRAGDYLNVHISTRNLDYDTYLATHGGQPSQQRRSVTALTKMANRKSQKGSLLKLRVNCVLTRQNYRGLTSLEQYIRSWQGSGVDDIRISYPIQPKEDTPFSFQLLTPDQTREILAVQNQLQALIPGRVSILPDRMEPSSQSNVFRRCLVKNDTITISPDGFAAPCCFTTYSYFPFRSGPIETAPDFLERIAANLKALAFVPREVCPPCSWDDQKTNKALGGE